MSSDLSPNTTLYHYRIVSKLGAGGMGEVYLAHDTKLDRKVALKILPADFGDDETRMSRFVREAKSVSALNHPNILTIHEIGEAENQHYIATEFIDGKTLRNLIEQKPLSLSESIEIACQISAALNAAHRAGIVHRDIKPENIMIRSDGLVKVLDFGLAKSTVTGASDPESETRIQSETQPGMILGTVAYMSPEQARGQVVDARSDVWSLGVVIYEMLTCRKPFSGATVTDTLANILHHEADLSAVQAVSPHLAQILSKLLAKKHEDRYQTISEAVVALKNLQRHLEFQSHFETPSTDQTKSEEQTQVIASSTTARSIEAVAESGAKRADEGFWIAVLPFKYRGSNFDLEVLAEGISEDIITGLSHFSYLRVISRSSTLRFTSETLDIRTVGKELGARYLLEGSLRQAGSMLRVTVQLVDANTGGHLWAENYNRSFSPEAVFELQDDLVPRIVSTVADQHGVLIHSIAEAMRNKSKDQFTPYEAVLSVFGFHERMTPEEHATLRDLLERVVRDYPDQGNCWAMLETLYADEYMFGFNVLPDSLGRALKAAQRAVELAPTSNLASQALAQAFFFRREMNAFRPVAERTISLNRMDTATVAVMGLLIACSGDWEKGCAICESAMQLNPTFPGWYRLAHLFDAYRREDYSAAVDMVARINIPGYYWTLLMGAAIHGQLGQCELAQKSLSELRTSRPDFHTAAHEELSKWFQPQLVEHLMDGLRKAGLEEGRGEGETGRKGDGGTGRRGEAEIGGRGETESPLPRVPASPLPPVSRVSPSSFPPTSPSSIAVLPFKNLSDDAEQEFFADGITEEILNALAQIQGLRVAGRSSSFSFKGRNEELRSVGAQLNVGTLLEGTLRRSGERLRITAQLIDASNGYQLWSERYDRVIDDIFTVQDEIAATIANRLQLSLTEQHSEEQPPTRNIEAFELYLKGRALLYQRGLSIAKAIDCFNRAVVLDPSYAQAWAGLADGYTTYGYSGYKRSKEVMPLALSAARRALELDETLAEAHSALACPTLLYERNYPLAEREFVSAIELNPNYPQGRAWYGLFYLLWAAGVDAQGYEEIQRLLSIDPLSGYAHAIAAFFCTSSNRSAQAVEYGKRGVELDPNSYLGWWGLSVALETDGQYEEASKAAEHALGISGRHVWALTCLTSIYGTWNKPESARALYCELQERSASEYVQPSMFAIAASAVDEMDIAIQLAQQAVDEKDPLFVMIARFWPQYRKLYAHRRFIEIVGQLRLPNWEM